MKLTPIQMQKIAEKVIAIWKSQNVFSPKVDEKIVVQRMVEALKAENDKILQLEKDVKAMLDDLEKSHHGQFERHKMSPLLKQKIAKERKMIL